MSHRTKRTTIPLPLGIAQDPLPGRPRPGPRPGPSATEHLGADIGYHPVHASAPVREYAVTRLRGYAITRLRVSPRSHAPTLPHSHADNRRKTLVTGPPRHCPGGKYPHRCNATAQHSTHTAPHTQFTTAAVPVTPRYKPTRRLIYAARPTAAKDRTPTPVHHTARPVRRSKLTIPNCLKSNGPAQIPAARCAAA